MLAYIAVVYAFIADVFVFNTSFTAIEVSGVCVVAVFMFSIVLRSLYVKKV